MHEIVIFLAAFLRQAPAQIGLTALHRLIKQILEPHRVTGAGFELLAVVTLHQPEGHMLHPGAFRDPAGAAGHLEHAGEVMGLAGIGHVDHPAGAIARRGRREAIANRRQIGGGVVEAAIALLHDHRQGIAILALHPFEEDTLRPRIHHQQTSGLQIGDNSGEVGVVEGFTPFAEADVEAPVDLLELPPRLITEQLPGAAAHRIAALQFHHLLASRGLEDLIGIEALLGLAVKGHQITQIHRIGRAERLRSHLLEMGDQHAELGAPVTHMIEPQHRMAAELQHPRQGVADDRRAQMPHMHLLGDVGTGEVHNHRRPGRSALPLNQRHPQPRVPQPPAQFGRQQLGPQGEIEEAGPGDLRRQAQGGKGRISLQLGQQRRGHLPGSLLQGFGQGQGAIGLKIAEFGLARRHQLGIQAATGGDRRGGRRREGPLQGRAQLAIESLGEAEHGQQKQPAGHLHRPAPL